MRRRHANVFIQMKHHYLAPVYMFLQNEPANGFKLAGAGCQDNVCRAPGFNRFTNQLRRSVPGCFAQLLRIL